MQLKAYVGIVGALVLNVITALIGGWDMWLKALVIFVVLDYLSGLLAAAYLKQLSSEIGFKGVCKKVLIFVLVAVAYQVDVLAGSTIIRVAVIGFYIGTEGLSILENAGKAGLPLPPKLKDTLLQMRKATK